MVRQWGQHWLPNSLATPERPDAHPRLTPCLVPKGRLLAAFQLKKAGERDNRWHLDGTDQKSDGRGGSLTRLNRRAHPSVGNAWPIYKRRRWWAMKPRRGEALPQTDANQSGQFDRECPDGRPGGPPPQGDDRFLVTFGEMAPVVMGRSAKCRSRPRR